MKKTLTLLIALLMAAMLTCAVVVFMQPGQTDNDFSYILLADGTAELTGYSGKAKKLTIPTEIDGVCITGIGDEAFRYCESLTNITIPDSVTYIGEGAFRYCYFLTNITIPNSVTYIWR